LAEMGDKTVAEDHTAKLAHELRAARVQSGRSLKDLERLTASSDSSLSRYLAGTSVPPWPVVEALCKVAERDPQELAPLWEAAQRTRIERRTAARPTKEQSADESTAVDPDETSAAPSSPGEGPDASDSVAPVTRPRWKSRSALIGAGVAGVGIAAIVVAVSVSGSGSPKGAAAAPKVSNARICPWHYVVTDGDPAPVLISDSTGPNRKHIGIYEPNQVFYVVDPPVIRDGLLQTLDGWVTAGNWIQRYNGPCLNRSDLTAVATSTR
jgi:transcriptional regulator with XRE-family HTH domain